MKKPALAFALALLVAGTGACGKSSDSGSNAAVTTPTSATASSPTSANAAGPVTDADVAQVDAMLHSLDTELSRLDSDMATGEGQVQ